MHVALVFVMRPMTKCVFDAVMAPVAPIILSPLMLAVSICAKLDSRGSVRLCSRHIGKGGAFSAASISGQCPTLRRGAQPAVCAQRRRSSAAQGCAGFPYSEGWDASASILARRTASIHEFSERIYGGSIAGLRPQSTREASGLCLSYL